MVEEEEEEVVGVEEEEEVVGVEEDVEEGVEKEAAAEL